MTSVFIDFVTYIAGSKKVFSKGFFAFCGRALAVCADDVSLSSEFWNLVSLRMYVGRFAPSPTGFLHLGNARTALLNAVFAKKNNGLIYLRIDDTDRVRSTKAFEDALIEDLDWLQISFKGIFRQSERLFLYKNAIDKLKEIGRLYACYETPEELQEKRLLLQKDGKPPRYDRAAKRLSKMDVERLKKEGRKPHWRFLLEDKKVMWSDLVRGDVGYNAASLSDPVLVRTDGSPSFLLTGCVDDLDLGVSHILRGQDHFANTAIQYQIMTALMGGVEKKIHFGHLPLLEERAGKLSKRLGSLTLRQLREEEIFPEVVHSFLLSLGLSRALPFQSELGAFAKILEMSMYKGSNPRMDAAQIYLQNKAYFKTLPFSRVRAFLTEKQKHKGGDVFWQIVRENVESRSDIFFWYDVCFSDVFDPRQYMCGEDLFAGAGFFRSALQLLPPAPFSEETWKEWGQRLQKETGMSGKKLYTPLRCAITGVSRGPVMQRLLPLVSREVVQKRLKKCT